MQGGGQGARDVGTDPLIPDLRSRASMFGLGGEETCEYLVDAI